MAVADSASISLPYTLPDQRKDSSTASENTLIKANTDETTAVNHACEASTDSKEAGATGGVAVEPKQDDKTSPDANGPTSLTFPASPTSPASPKTTNSQSQLYQYKRKDEETFKTNVAKAHAIVRGESTIQALADDDKDKVVATYATMVSQMSHLLAAAGLGKNVTARAVAYINGADKVEPAKAVRQARLDRREANKKHNNRRPSNFSKKESTKASIKSEDNTDSKTNTTIETEKTATDHSTSIAAKDKDATTFESQKPQDKDNKPGAVNGEAHTNGTKQANGQKKGFRRRWFQGKGRYRVGAKENNAQYDDAQETNANGHRAVQKLSKAKNGTAASTANSTVLATTTNEAKA